MPCSPTKGHCATPIPLVGYWDRNQKSSVHAGQRGVSVTPNKRLLRIFSMPDVRSNVPLQAVSSIRVVPSG